MCAVLLSLTLEHVKFKDLDSLGTFVAAVPHIKELKLLFPQISDMSSLLRYRKSAIRMLPLRRVALNV